MQENGVNNKIDIPLESQSNCSKYRLEENSRVKEMGKIYWLSVKILQRGRCPAPLVRPCAVPGLLQRIRELERDLEGLQGEVQKYCAEQESIRNQLAEKAKVTVRLWGMRRRAGRDEHSRYLGRLARVADAWDEGQRAPSTQAVQAEGQNVLSYSTDPEGRR